MGLWAAVYGAMAERSARLRSMRRVCESARRLLPRRRKRLIAALPRPKRREVRDIYVRVCRRQLRARRDRARRWLEIDGCPVNGPAVDARGRHVAVAWFTASTKDGQAFVAFSDDRPHVLATHSLDEQACRGHLDVELLRTARRGFMDRVDGRAPR